MSRLRCPVCGTTLEGAPPAPPEPRRCRTCATAWEPPPPRRARASSKRVAQVVRRTRPDWAKGDAAPPEEPRAATEPAARRPRPTTKTPVLKPAPEPEFCDIPQSPFAGLLEPDQLPRFAPLSILDESADDRLLLALDQHSQRLAALRLGKPTGDGLARRTAHEAALLARVAHPNVVALVGEGRAAGLSWIAYQYCEGAPLRRLLDHGPLPPREAGFIVAQILDGLEAMHRAGYVHRELSPDRVRDSGTGLFKVLGFARALPPPGTAPLDWRMSGDPRYLAPEQSAGDRPTPAADVYAAGAVLYELVTGAPPFLTSESALLAMKHATEIPVPPGARVAGAAAFDDAILRALSKAPQERFASARSMSDALRALIG